MSKRLVLSIVSIFSLAGYLLIYQKPSLMHIRELSIKHYQFFAQLVNKSSNYFNIDSYWALGIAASSGEYKRKTIDYLSAITANMSHYKKKKIGFLTHFAAAKSSVCLIMKNGHSVIRFVSCLLSLAESNDRQAFERFDSLLTFRAAWWKDCNRLIGKKKPNSDNFEKVVFVRDPVDRFVSGYLFVCRRQKACFNCDDNVTCFLSTLYNCMKTDMTYSKMCKYKSNTRETRQNNSGFIFAHLHPQAGYCNLWETYEQYKVIRYSRDTHYNFSMEVARPVLSKGRMKTLDGRLRQSTIHAAEVNEAKNLKIMLASDRDLMRMLTEIYFIDYELFDLDIPQFIVDLKLFNE